MPIRGKLVVLEGIDGSGKRTQLDLLGRAFHQRGIPYTEISFPNYHGFFGKLVGQFLNGDFGPLEAVDPHFSAMLYAGDRVEAKPRIEAALGGGKTLLCDRYIASNLAHQGARVPPEKREEFLKWLRQLEYEVYGLPIEDLVIYLRVPAVQAQRLVAQKSGRDYTDRSHDLQEADLSHLETALQVYDELAKQRNWLKVECCYGAIKALRAPESINEEIVAAIESRIVPALQAGG